MEEHLPEGNKEILAELNRDVEKQKCEIKILSKLKIIWAFVSFLISVADVTVIIYLSYLHFSHSSDLIAWLMLLPILFNFIGIFTFLSNKKERQEMANLGSRKLWKNWMFFPVIGPSVCALRLFAYAFEEKDAEKFERLESLLTRMKQYESYFRAAPEAFIQITARIITYSDQRAYHAEDHWTTACIALCVYALAESHLYGGVINYYKMFHYDPREDAWKTDHIKFKWKVVLFVFTYCSITPRLLGEALQKATACFYFSDTSFGEVIIITFISQFIFRAGIYAIYNCFIGSLRRQEKIKDEGVYGAFTYSWRCLFMSFDFQSYSKVIYVWFYIENFLMIFTPYIWIYGTPLFGNTEGRNVLEDRTIFHLYAGTAAFETLIAIIIQLTVRCNLEKKSMMMNN